MHAVSLTRSHGTVGALRDVMATTSGRHHPQDLRPRRSWHERPTGFTRRTTAFATLVLVTLAAFTVGAVLDDSRYAIAVMALAIPILLFVLTHRENG